MSSPIKIVILGATGGCVDILDAINDVNAAAASPRYECLGFLDDKADLWGKPVLNATVLGPFSRVAEFRGSCRFVTGIGSAYNFWRREAILARLGVPTEEFETIVHPRASISRYAAVGRGCVIYQNTVIGVNATLGDHVLALPNSVINHDVTVGDYTIITSAVSLSGGARVGRLCYIGTNSAVRQDVKVGDRSLIAMGSVVLNDVEERAAVGGAPARRLRTTHRFED